jgi:hypothetical protein
LKLNNPLEIENEVAAFNVSFFKTNMSTNVNFLKKLYTNLIDIMQLSNFLDLFTFCTEYSTNEAKQIVEFILTDKKFHNLFSLSLELHKFIFMKDLMNLASDFNNQFLLSLLKNPETPFAPYYQRIDRGEDSEEEYRKVMRRHVEGLALKKES